MIITAVDDKYLDEAAFLIRSCARHAPEQGFYLHLINSTEARVAPLRAAHPRLTVGHEQRPYDAERWRGLMCCARTAPLLHVLRTYGEPTVYLDSDIIVMKPLETLFALLREHDLAVKLRPQLEVRGAGGTLDAGKFNSGVIAIRPSPAGLTFAEEYDRRVRSWIDAGHPPGHVDERAGVFSAVDQEFLYTVYREFADRLSFTPLPEIYNDSRFHASSVIWHGKGTARSQPQYVLAKLSYGPWWRYWAFGLLGYPWYLAQRVIKRLRRRRRAS